MTSTAEEKAFLTVPVAAITRGAEIILEFPSYDRADALETAERRSGPGVGPGCTEITVRSRVS
jgi:hypothetical protein